MSLRLLERKLISKSTCHLLTLYPKYIPPIAPTALKMIEEKESSLPPQMSGMELPTAEPTTIPNQISFFESILK
jgi:hypothetical protein